MSAIKEYRILMLEDVPADAELVERQLRKGGLKFVSRRVMAKDEFVKELREFAPDIVLSDYRLPQFDGLAALDIVRKDYPEIPFIIISGAIGEELAVETLRRGATDYVLKDSLTRLSSIVERALRDADKRGIEKMLQQRITELEIENKDMRERELKIRKLQTELKELKDLLEDLAGEKQQARKA